MNISHPEVSYSYKSVPPNMYTCRVKDDNNVCHTWIQIRTDFLFFTFKQDYKYNPTESKIIFSNLETIPQWLNTLTSYLSYKLFKLVRSCENDLK